METNFKQSNETKTHSMSSTSIGDRKTISDSAFRIRIVNNIFAENIQITIPTLELMLRVNFSNDTAIECTFIVTNEKKLSDDVRSYTMIQVLPGSYDVIKEYTLYRKDVSEEYTSNLMKCPCCKDIYFQWQELKLEAYTEGDISNEFLDPLQIPFEDLAACDEYMCTVVEIQKIPDGYYCEYDDIF
jgi:hypothetical protein